MNYAKLFIQTRREAPAGLDLPGQQMLVRGGYIQPLPGGECALLPLGQRSLSRLEARLAREFAALGGMEVDFPPGSGGAAPVLEMARGQLRSHRQLPALLFRRGWEAAAAPTRGGGLFGAHSSRVMETFLFESDPVRLERTSAEVAGAVLGLLAELGLHLPGGEDLPGAGIQAGQAWLYPHEAGGETLLQCEECGYSAAPSAVRFHRPIAAAEAPAPLRKVATPGCKTIASLAQFLGIPESRTAKAVFLTADEKRLVFAVVRGDRDVNEAALRRLLGTDRLRPAGEDEIRAAGAAPGYASPVGLRGVSVIVDAEIPASPNLVAGANEEGYHLLNVNYGRDYTAAQVAEIALARPGDSCPECGAALGQARGVQLVSAVRYAESALAGAAFVDETGKTRPPLLERYRLDLTRAFACLAEACSDAKGLRLPPAAAPFAIHLVVLDAKSPAVQEATRQVLAALEAEGIEPLVDDRPDSPGVKFNDADLIGLPARVTVSDRALQQGGVELKRRAEEGRQIVAPGQLIKALGQAPEPA